MKVTGEQVFSVPSNEFGVSASNEGYTLAYSVDGQTFTNYTQATPANENLFVCGCPKFQKYKLVGNNSEVEVKW